LSGICRQLEPFILRFGTPTKQMSPFLYTDLLRILDTIPSMPSHDNLLFCAVLLTGYHALMDCQHLLTLTPLFSRTSPLGTFFFFSTRNFDSPQLVTVPTRHWFFSGLRVLFPSSYAGPGVNFSVLQAIVHWSSPVFRIYIRKNPHRGVHPSTARLDSFFPLTLSIFSHFLHIISLFFLFSTSHTPTKKKKKIL
jgi:hypothetical protein